MSELLEDMLSGYANLLAERHLHLRLLIAPHVVVRAGEDLLETVVENIVENAISFAPTDGSIQVRLARSGAMAVFTVEDDGPGVDPVNIERIFERYFSQRDHVETSEHRTLDATGTDGGMRTVVPFDQPVQPAGTGDSLHFGIGLWIVRRNVEAVGGRVTARNRESGGLLMRVELPIAH
jgi:two-component system sensor histidine kinase ChvG